MVWNHCQTCPGASKPHEAASTLHICSASERALQGCEQLTGAERTSRSLMLSGWVVYLGVFVCVCGVIIYNIIITPPEISSDQRKKEMLFNNIWLILTTINHNHFLWRSGLKTLMKIYFVMSYKHRLILKQQNII